jgi:hypothetical protein
VSDKRIDNFHMLYIKFTIDSVLCVSVTGWHLLVAAYNQFWCISPSQGLQVKDDLIIWPLLLFCSLFFIKKRKRERGKNIMVHSKGIWVSKFACQLIGFVSNRSFWSQMSLVKFKDPCLKAECVLRNSHPYLILDHLIWASIGFNQILLKDCENLTLVLVVFLVCGISCIAAYI